MSLKPIRIHTPVRGVVSSCSTIRVGRDLITQIYLSLEEGSRCLAQTDNGDLRPNDAEFIIVNIAGRRRILSGERMQIDSYTSHLEIIHRTRFWIESEDRYAILDSNNKRLYEDVGDKIIKV